MLKINPKLKEKVLAEVPENYDKLKQVLRIYYQLCNILDYSMNFYALSYLVEYYTDPENLIDIDGEKKSDVVCYTFNAIMAQILVDKGLCDENWLAQAGIFEEDGSLGVERFHKTLQVQIGDGLTIDFDPATSIISKNAFQVAKGKAKISAVTCIKGDAKILEQAIKEVEADIQNLQEFEADYIQMKEDENTWAEFSLEERKDLFLRSVLSKEMPVAPHFALVEYVKKKKLFFKEEERGKELSRNIELLFVTDKEDNKVKGLFLFNKEGYVDDKGYENFENLEIYEISIDKRKANVLSLDEFREKCKNNYCEFLERKVYFEMSKVGKVEVQKQLDLNHNIIGYLRHIVCEDKYYACDEHGNILE